MDSSAGRLRYSYRSLQDALAAARDGDTICLQRGMHNGLGCGIRKERSKGYRDQYRGLPLAERSYGNPCLQLLYFSGSVFPGLA